MLADEDAVQIMSGDIPDFEVNGIFILDNDLFNESTRTYNVYRDGILIATLKC